MVQMHSVPVFPEMLDSLAEIQVPFSKQNLASTVMTNLRYFQNCGPVSIMAY